MGFIVDRGYDLETAKVMAINELDVWYGGVVLDVFDCNVMGAPHRYYCSEADQLRMLNGKVSNVSMALMCGPVPAQADTDPVYQWTDHTSTECGKVHTDYVQFTKNIAVQFEAYKVQINAATTVSQVDVVFHLLWG
jgi:hypothetical protein